MKPILEEKLKKDFPNVYRGANDPKCRWDIRVGFRCADGWFKIIYVLSAKIEALILKLPKKKRKDYWACQIKEKFGGLRFYMSTMTEEMSSVIDVAEELASGTCETCGNTGKTVKRSRLGGWIQTWCRICRTKHRIKRFFERIGDEWRYLIHRTKDKLTRPLRKYKSEK